GRRERLAEVRDNEVGAGFRHSSISASGWIARLTRQPGGMLRRDLGRLKFPGALKAAEDGLQVACRQARLAPPEFERHRQRRDSQSGDGHTTLDEVVVVGRGLEAARAPYAWPADDSTVRKMLDNLQPQTAEHLVLGSLHEAVKVGEMHDPRHVGIREL